MGIVAAYAVPHPPLIVPSVGRGEERAIQATVDAYGEVARRIVAHRPGTIIVSSPHAPFFRDCFFVATGERSHGDMGRFHAFDEGIETLNDSEFSDALLAVAALLVGDLPLVEARAEALGNVSRIGEQDVETPLFGEDRGAVAADSPAQYDDLFHTCISFIGSSA